MTWVKICGTTNLEDALLAVDAGADAVGFVFYEKSPRCVKVDTARNIIEKLPENVEKVGVFVGPGSNAVDVLRRAGLTAIQSYFSLQGFAGSPANEGLAFDVGLMPAGFRSLMAFSTTLFGGNADLLQQTVTAFASARTKIAADGTEPPAGILDTFLLDSGNSQQPGGTGAIFDWAKTKPIADVIRSHGLKLVVAGGLKPENVCDAIDVLQPWGVDVVSGVEASPGKKDPEKVRAFVRAVRDMDQKVS
jgi:phosphoribosylanthranilate isomerase